MKDNFLMKKEWGPMIQALPSEKVGELLKAIYMLDSNPDIELDDPILHGIFVLMKGYIISNEKKYAEKCQKNAEIARKKWEDNEPTDESNDADATQVTKLDANVCERIDKNANDDDNIRNTPDKSYSLIISNIISHLNDKAHKHYRASSKTTKELIIARLKDGYTEQDLIRIIDNKVDDWLGDPKMEQYLAPDTLFRPSHIERYLNQKPFEEPETPEQPTEEEDTEWVDLSDEEWEAKMRALDFEEEFNNRMEEGD